MQLGDACDGVSKIELLKKQIADGEILIGSKDIPELLLTVWAEYPFTGRERLSLIYLLLLSHSFLYRAVIPTAIAVSTKPIIPITASKTS